MVAAGAPSPGQEQDLLQQQEVEGLFLQVRGCTLCIAGFGALQTSRACPSRLINTPRVPARAS